MPLLPMVGCFLCAFCLVACYNGHVFIFLLCNQTIISNKLNCVYLIFCISVFATRAPIQALTKEKLVKPGGYY